MAKVGEFFKSQAIKAGVDLAAEANKPFVDLLANPAFADHDVPDQVAGIINSALISLKEAKNGHSELRNHYTSQALDSLDADILAQAKLYELPDSDVDELKLERSSYKRVKLLNDKVKKLTEDKALANKPDLKKINDQINALNAELALEKAKPATIQADYEKKIKDLQLHYGKSGLFKEYKTIFDRLPGDARSVGLNSMLDSVLLASGAKLELNDAGEIVLLTKDGQTYHDKTTNTPLTVNQFVEKALASSGLIVTNSNGQNSGSDGSGSSSGQGGQNQNNNQNQNRNNGGNGNGASDDAVTNAIKEYNNLQSEAYKNAPQIA